MGHFIEQVDQYIARASDFAQPILRHWRALVHQACPEVEEVIKWGFPNFMYRGQMCSMASFKQHCSFGFWKMSLMADPDGILKKEEEGGMGSLGKIQSMDQLPPDPIMLKYLHEAMRLNEQGIKKARPKKEESEKVLEIPDWFTQALQTDQPAMQTFEAFSYSHRKEYVEWIVEAKTEATREKRLAQMLEWLREGKSRNWKYGSS